MGAGIIKVRIPHVSKPCSGLQSPISSSPVALNVVEIVFAFYNPTFLDGFIVHIVIPNVQIIGVLFATIWCASTRWYEDSRKVETPGNVITSVRYADNAVLTASGPICRDNSRSPRGFYHGHGWPQELRQLWRRQTLRDERMNTQISIYNESSLCSGIGWK